MVVNYRLGTADKRNISNHLWHCDNLFNPPLSSRVDIEKYAEKISDRSVNFEAWEEKKLIGLVAIYCNNLDQSTAFITNVSVLSDWQGKGIAFQLMANCLHHVCKMGYKNIELEVNTNNESAVLLYQKYGFTVIEKNGLIKKMRKNLSEGN